MQAATDATMSERTSPFHDDSFDETLGATILPWLPWVGSDYHRSPVKTLLLGESPSALGPRATAVRHRILNRDGTRERQLCREVVYLRHFERAVWRKKRPSGLERMRLWSQLVYHNLILRVLPTHQERPTDYDYKVGWEAFLPLAETLQAQRCIAFGLERDKVDALQRVLAQRGAAMTPLHLPPVGSHAPLAFSFPLAAGRLDIVFLRHPRAQLSWKRWGEILLATGMLPDPAPRKTS